MKRALKEVVTNHFDEITNSNNAILLLKGNTNLADVFIQMIRLAYIIKNFRSNNLVALQQHVIQAFNRRWEEFDISLYLSQLIDNNFIVRGLQNRNYALIALATGNIWRMMENNQNLSEDSDEDDDKNDDEDEDNDNDDDENNNNSKNIEESIMDYDVEELAVKYCE
ncbi:hypothetical protein RclHR1_07310017 [Rhizophagus clarus]|uniref:Uncharacterized protein n=1 Tax=Rhizophagus clarus TaxID=94130 RepID=A0A2Z6S8E4_9GLOM|nr:hypothetical protein RclHR1_07310017 [Rhizophagus clarus]